MGRSKRTSSSTTAATSRTRSSRKSRQKVTPTTSENRAAPKAALSPLPISDDDQPQQTQQTQPPPPPPPPPSTDWESLSHWSDASVAQVAAWWKLSDQDVTKLWQLQARLDDVHHWQNQPNQVVRYYRDAHGNLAKAEHKFRRMIQWRIDERVDAITDEYVPPHPLLSEYLPTTVLDKYDRDGDPIWLERIGACDSWGLFQAFGKEALLRYAVWIRESCIKGAWAREYRERNGGQPPMRATAIIDMEGMGLDHLKPSLLPLLKEGLAIVQVCLIFCLFDVCINPPVYKTSPMFPSSFTALLLWVW